MWQLRENGVKAFNYLWQKKSKTILPFSPIKLGSDAENSLNSCVKTNIGFITVWTSLAKFYLLRMKNIRRYGHEKITEKVTALWKQSTSMGQHQEGKTGVRKGSLWWKSREQQAISFVSPRNSGGFGPLQACHCSRWVAMHSVQWGLGVNKIPT